MTYLLPISFWKLHKLQNPHVALSAYGGIPKVMTLSIPAIRMIRILKELSNQVLM